MTSCYTLRDVVCSRHSCQFGTELWHRECIRGEFILFTSAADGRGLSCSRSDHIAHDSPHEESEVEVAPVVEGAVTRLTDDGRAHSEHLVEDVHQRHITCNRRRGRSLRRGGLAITDRNVGFCFRFTSSLQS